MTSVVVLTRDFQFWSEVSMDKFWKWLVKEKIEVIAYDDGKDATYFSHNLSLPEAISTFKVRKPLVVRLLGFVGYKVKTEEIGFSKEAVFQRDNNICQYWHYDKFNRAFKYVCKEDERSLDHVIPKSRGGSNTFDNTVCACKTCNIEIKKNRTPEEAGLKLIRKPIVPKRNRGDFVSIKFAYNPRKLSHKIYVEKILGGTLTIE
jgi:hypothetical protein